ncbi:hypothetical protein JXA88_13460 [Candidatus Fermentibacteria bacterium]|nr:hypothetical protein [Candidatus Fermentibacteria bacterium]
MNDSPRSVVQRKLTQIFRDNASRVQAEAILHRHSLEPQQTGGDRVLLAILKLSDGDLEKLRRVAAIAMSDWRDVVAMAEYPEMLRIGAGIGQLDSQTRRAIRNRDLRQYHRWLHGKGNPEAAAGSVDP